MAERGNAAIAEQQIKRHRKQAPDQDLPDNRMRFASGMKNNPTSATQNAISQSSSARARQNIDLLVLRVAVALSVVVLMRAGPSARAAATA